MTENQDRVFNSPVKSPNSEESSLENITGFNNEGFTEYYNPNIIYSMGTGYPVFEYYPEVNNNYFENAPSLTDDQMSIIQQSMNAEPQMVLNDENINMVNEENINLVNEVNSKKRPNSRGNGNNVRPRKKRKIEVEVDLDPTSENYKVTLSRDELLTLTSKQFEAYVKQLESNKTLSYEERRELKRQRTLIKNRESAQASRQRKKSYVDEMEGKVQNLTNENSNLFDKVTNLSKENDQLKTEVVYLQNILSKSGLMDMLSNGAKKIQTLQNDFFSNKSQMKNTGIAFFILLFTFGLFFNIQIDSNPFITEKNIPETYINEDFKLTSNDKPYFDIFSQMPDYSNKRLEDSYKKKTVDMKEKINSLKSNDIKPEQKEQETKNNKNPTLYAVKIPSSNTTYLICDYNSTLFNGLSLPNPENQDK